MELMKNISIEKIGKNERISELFTYTHEEFFNELSNIEIAFFTTHIELYEKKPQEFLNRLANEKEQHNYMNLLRKTIKSSIQKEKRLVVQQFFEQVSLQQLAKDINELALKVPYTYEKNTAKYAFGTWEEEQFVPLQSHLLQQGKLYLEGEEGPAYSVQAVIYFLFVNSLLYETDERHIIGYQCNYPEALFAFAHAEALQKESLDNFYMVTNKNVVTASLFAVVAFSKSIRFLFDALTLPAYEEDEHFFTDILTLIQTLAVRHQQVLHGHQTHYLQMKIQKLERAEKQQVAKYAELQKKFEKQKEKLDVQLQKMKQLKLEVAEKTQITTQNDVAEKQLAQELVVVRQQLKLVKEEMKEEKKKYTKEANQAQKKYDEQCIENQKLVLDVSELQKQLMSEKRHKLQVEELSFEKWLEKGQELLQHLSISQEEQLKDFIAFATNMLNEHQLARPKQDLATNRIGYCRVDADGHFINLGDNIWQPISEVPAPMYISDFQFVEVTKELAVVELFDYYFKEGPADSAITQFVEVENRHNEAFANVNGLTTKIKYRDNAYIKDRQIISINEQNEMVSYYHNRSITLDDLMPAICLKGHEPLYIVMTLANGYVVRDLQQKERFIELEEPSLAHSFIIMDEMNTLHFKDNSGLMWKKANSYTKKQLASVSELEDGLFVLKSNQEYVQLFDVPQQVTLELGDMIWIDEFNRFIELVVVEEAYISLETIEQKLLNSGRKVTKKVTKPHVLKDKQLLVIGNIRLSERYKKYFGELGYEVEVVDGAGPFEKIRQATSKFNTIIYSTAFTSHKNSIKMNKDVTKPYILCDSTAPKVMRYILERAI